MNALQPQTPAETALGLTLPSRRDEEWRWTDLKRLINRSYTVEGSAASAKAVAKLVAASPLAKLNAQRLVIVNGVLDHGLSRLQGLAVSTSAPAILHTDPLLALNAKLSASVTTLTFTEAMDAPIELLHVSLGDNAAIANRTHIEVEDGASATIIETFVGEGAYLNVPLTTVTLGKGARLDRVKIETEAADAQHLSHVVVLLAEKAHLNDFTLTAGAVLNRQNANIDFVGENAKAFVAGSYKLKGRQHADTRLVVDHRVPNCQSRELFKCVMDDEARGIFQGKVIVRQDAQKTDGKQSSHALLLSEKAEFDAKPELEIYADDVVCGHGATCGDLNHDHLFYLMARGIPEAQARAMLVAAFVEEAMEQVENEALREALYDIVERRLMG